MLKSISQVFFKGLLAVLPLAITLSILYWLGSGAEAIFGSILMWILPASWYWPGMGLVAGIIMILGIGFLLNAYIFRKVVWGMERLFEKIPLVKTIYNSVHDIAKFAAASDSDQDLQKAVAVMLDKDIQVIGFITDKSLSLSKEEEHLIAVYVPLSYQIGGVTLLLPQSRLKILDIGVKDAMRLVLTAAMTKSPKEEGL